jgi:hypothetical protein
MSGYTVTEVEAVEREKATPEAERDALKVQLDAALARIRDVGLIRRAISDPGQFAPRGYGYAHGSDFTEPITNWAARAVVAALAVPTDSAQETDRD